MPDDTEWKTDEPRDEKPAAVSGGNGYQSMQDASANRVQQRQPMATYGSPSATQGAGSAGAGIAPIPAPSSTAIELPGR